MQYVDRPTRDVLVVFDKTGDREFIGFGSASANEFADCFISAEKLPEGTFRVSFEIGLMKCTNSSLKLISGGSIKTRTTGSVARGMLVHATYVATFKDCLQDAQFLITGTLGLAYPETAEAMRKAVQLSKQGPCSVSATWLAPSCLCCTIRASTSWRFATCG